MPGVYKLKTCPECKKEHRKRGVFCSQGCSNSHREVSDKVRENMRKVAAESQGTPERIAQGHLVKLGITVNAEDFAINPPTIHELPEGYDKAEDW